MKLKLKKLTITKLKKLIIEGFSFEINLEPMFKYLKSIFRHAVIAFLLLTPPTSREQTKLPDEPKQEIKIMEQLPTTNKRNKLNARRSKSVRKVAGRIISKQSKQKVCRRK